MIDYDESGIVRVDLMLTMSDVLSSIQVEHYLLDDALGHGSPTLAFIFIMCLVMAHFELNHIRNLGF